MKPWWESPNGWCNDYGHTVANYGADGFGDSYGFDCYNSPGNGYGCLYSDGGGQCPVGSV